MTPQGPGLVRATMLVAARDLRGELRTRTAAQGVAFYAAVSVLLFSFALGPDSETLRRVAPGLLWMALALASLLPAARSFAAERDQGTLETLLLHPVPREALFLGKVLAGFALLAAAGAVAAALMLVLYGLRTPAQPWLLAPGLILGALGLAAAGTFYGAVSAGMRGREALLPMLVLPVIVPLLIAATQVFDAGMNGGDGGRWLVLLGAFDALLVVLPATVVGFVLEQ
jgi:heme exporter protein B